MPRGPVITLPVQLMIRGIVLKAGELEDSRLGCAIEDDGVEVGKDGVHDGFPFIFESFLGSVREF
jgi:hypothetical protein